MPKINRHFKTKFKCAGVIKENDKVANGAIIQLQGDHRIAIKEFLFKEGIVWREENIKVHGY